MCAPLARQIVFDKAGRQLLQYDVDIITNKRKMLMSMLCKKARSVIQRWMHLHFTQVMAI